MGTRSSKEKTPTNPVDLLKKKEHDKELRRTERIKEHERIREEIRKKEKEINDKKTRQFLMNASGAGAVRIPSTHPDIIKFADIEAKKRMQNQLALNSGTFILNQLMMSIQFLGNYDREKSESLERNRLLENNKTMKITKHCKNVILPDILHDAVDQHIKYRARHGYLKKKIQTLHKQTMYIVHENIEILNPGETTDYSTLPGQSPIYRMELETIDNNRLKDKHHVGYVQLKSFEIIRRKQDSISFNKVYDELVEEDEDGENKKKESSGSSSLDTNDEIKVIDNNEQDEEDDDMPTSRFKTLRPSIVIMSKQKRLSPNNNNNLNYSQLQLNRFSNMPVPTSISNSTSTDSSEYEYAYITALNTHQPLSIIRSSSNSDEPLSTVILPDICITNKRVAIDIDEDEDDEDNGNGDKDDNDSNSELDDKQYTVKQYLNSKYFLNYFINMFKETLAQDLGVTELDLLHATFKGACIYTDFFEIIPVIACPWPKEAYEWPLRRREVFQNPMTKQQFQWLTMSMVTKITSFGCHVVPIGYAPKTGTNPNRELEWKIIFPEAEKYLEDCLTSAQTKVYMATKVLLKTFVEPFIDKKLNMFTTEHLRAHLFWQCEKNFAAWPEEYLGEALLRFLQALLEQIKIQRLPDYFLPRRNLFENIPGKVLVELHKRIFRITENPVMYLMISFRNLKFLQNFYPRFCYKRLYATMIIDNPLKIINPAFRNQNERNMDFDTDDDEDVNGYGHISVFNKREKNDKTKRKKTRLVRFKEAEKTKKELERINERRASTETIDITFQPLKHMEQLRRKIIFEIFTDHFIKMAKQSYKLQSLNQSRVYLNQASRLSSLILNENGKEEWLNYTEKINSLEMTIVSSMDNMNGPDLPRRKSSKITTITAMNKFKGQQNNYGSNNNNKKFNRSISEESDFYTNIDLNNEEVMTSSTMQQRTSFIPEEFSNSDDNDDVANVINSKNDVNMQSQSILKDKQLIHKVNGNLPNGFRKSTNLISPLKMSTNSVNTSNNTVKDKSLKKINKTREISVDVQVHSTPKKTVTNSSNNKILSKKRESLSKHAFKLNNTNGIEDVGHNRGRKQSVSFGTTTTQEINFSESIITTTAKSKTTSSKVKYLNKNEHKGIIITKNTKTNDKKSSKQQILILNGDHDNQMNENSDEDGSTQL